MGSKEVWKQKFKLVIFQKIAENSICKSNFTSHSLFFDPYLLGSETCRFHTNFLEKKLSSKVHYYQLYITFLVHLWRGTTHVRLVFLLFLVPRHRRERDLRIHSRPSVHSSVRPSGAFRKNHSLEFSEILHERIISLYWRNSIFRFLKKTDCIPRGSKRGQKAPKCPEMAKMPLFAQ